MYSNGESERVVGKAIEKYNIPRGRLVIMVRTRVSSLLLAHMYPGSCRPSATSPLTRMMSRFMHSVALLMVATG